MSRESLDGRDIGSGSGAVVEQPAGECVDAGEIESAGLSARRRQCYGGLALSPAEAQRRRKAKSGATRETSGISLRYDISHRRTRGHGAQAPCSHG
jgi:hypothetical protein